MKVCGNEHVRICLIGAPFDTNNRGVSALASSLVRLMMEALPAARLSFFMGNPQRCNKLVEFAGKEVKVDLINYRLSPKARLHEHILFMLLLALLIRLCPSDRFRAAILSRNSRLRDIDHCDFVGAINGGDSFSDIYGVVRLIGEMLPLIITILLGKRQVLLPQTYGPFNSRLAKVIARWIILRSSLILSRDRDSIQLVRDLLPTSKRDMPIYFCPDVAFMLPSALPSQFTLEPPADTFGNDSWVGINVNGLIFHGGYTGHNMFGLRFNYRSFILSLIERLMETTSAKVLLIPHTYGEEGNVNSDPAASSKVYGLLKDRYKDRLFVLTGEYREFEIKGIIGCCDFFIGSRMHACIAAISQGIPTAAVAYSKKFLGVFKGVGLEKMVIDARTLDLDEAIQSIVDLYRRRNSERESMKQKIDQAQMQVRQTFSRLLFNSESDLKIP